ncbi:MAG TPA: hypothetical protein DEG17_25130 [Cyanobacteria bacterium UBA11149]|nr:hypothetical protein [Cyanobacteria bacterium UBA11367]HBE60666.1 hypothetical protein [Cyanobacteria bacterium UBA11366]HBK62793.1 hypothetical protein [Cyanobacteria bacterium UBA11166]HBR73268.1 hypothetical protein [Cyanobacteria bacterium UBA11159]HBS67784.1 hypothetical protein [Cyanobacteria bacterium UBA11153]HBW92063.1 hypothetical protein [Cyanobacteria bacterium UBA11149]HCA97938.1 hypothetical protein [Cyanobacteria bacterium UBA9226]
MSGNSSDYIKYLPATLQGDEFIGKFILAFEAILTGQNLLPETNPGIIKNSDTNPPGIEAILEAIHTYFNPDLTPEEFLPWLANWVAFSLRDDWQASAKREFIKKIVPLYRLRGTKEGLSQILTLYLKSVNLPDKVTIYEDDNYPPYYFQVSLTLPRLESSRYWQQVRIAKAIIDQEKPAYTYYGLKINVPSMQITGNLYPLNIKPIDFVYLVGFQVKYKITAKINRQTNENNNLRLTIKGGLSERKIYASQFGTGNLELNYTLKEQEIKTIQNWYIEIDNLSDSDATGAISITTTYSESKPESSSPLKSETQSKEEKFFLPPGLKIFTKREDKYENGNTWLGTEGI